MASEFRPQDDYDALLGGLTGREFFDSLQDIRPPEDLSPLPFSDDLTHRMGLPITHELVFPRLRRDLVTELRGMVQDPASGLDADEDTIQDLRLGISEGVQNAFRNNNGVYRLDVQRTAAGGLYAAVHNIAVTYPPGPVWHLRTGQRPLRLDGNAAKGHDLGLEDDEHGWGLGLISQMTMHGAAPGMGFYNEQIAAIPNISTGQTVEITRLVFWGLYARTQARGVSDAA